MAPLLSVVTVVLNAEPTLERPIKSIVDQKLDGVECVVVDGASTDGSPEIIRRCASSID
jgi:glycosyltransferase involved in cell wall biosynthesis